MSKILAIVMKPSDNTATVIEPIGAGATVLLDIAGSRVSLHVTEHIPFAHKFATKDIGQGDPIIKYGECIGVASRDIKIGQHVHVHNLESRRGRGDKTE
jgi:altronate dehydratase small subunit